MIRLPLLKSCTGLAVLLLCSLTDARAQDQPATSRGENFSAKPPAQLFASDCTGAGCHKGPQGLGRGQLPGSLASFLREHYTNSRESAAALAGYLSNVARGPEPKDPRTPRSGKPAATAAAPPAGIPGWGEAAAPAEHRPAPNEARAPRQTPGGRTSRAAVRPDEDPAAASSVPSAAEPAPHVRAPRGRQPAATAAAPAPPPEPEVAAPPAPPPAPRQYDIFD